MTDARIRRCTWREVQCSDGGSRNRFWPSQSRHCAVTQQVDRATGIDQLLTTVTMPRLFPSFPPTTTPLRISFVDSVTVRLSEFVMTVVTTETFVWAFDMKVWGTEDDGTDSLRIEAAVDQSDICGLQELTRTELIRQRRWVPVDNRQLNKRAPPKTGTRSSFDDSSSDQPQKGWLVIVMRPHITQRGR